MFPASNIAIHGGTFINQNRTSRGMDILMERVATGAFHDSDELYDAPKCHPHTRVAVLDDIMQWVGESGSARDHFMMWLFGPAGAGKSAIAKRIAEIAAERDLLIGDFFFSRTSPTRGTKDRLIATLAYQLTVSIPGTRSYIEDTIERDPGIFHKNILTQIDNLLIKPFQLISLTQIGRSPKLIIIDGLDECNDSKSQVAILEAISRSFPQHNLSIKFLVVSRPEISIVTSFNTQEPLKSIHLRLALDGTYQPNDDIRLFFSDKFKRIQLTHPSRSTIPISWPTQEILNTLVKKSSGQFIYASAVVKFVESICHRPSVRLNIILGVSPPGRTNPFAELDALYNHLLSSVDDIQLTLQVLSLYVLTPAFGSEFTLCDMSPEAFLSLEPGDIQFALMGLSSIVTYHEPSLVEILHASLFDFLSDKHRSTTFYIDMASTCIDFVRRILQYVKGPDGIRAGDLKLFSQLNRLSPWILKGQPRSDILNFDLDALINASITRQYKGPPLWISVYTTETFWIWERFLDDAGLEDRDKKEALDRLNTSLESRLPIYQSDWRLRLLLTLALAAIGSLNLYYVLDQVPYCRRVDILLEMESDHDLHLVDQDALDLRHAYIIPRSLLISSSYVDDDKYASAALHCMRFLFNPPKHSKENECPEMGLIYVEWKATCDMTLEILCKFLPHANASLELVQFISNHDIHPAVQNLDLSSDRIWEANVHILAFLSRANVCASWRIISAIQRFSITTHQQPSNSEEGDASSESSDERSSITGTTSQRQSPNFEEGDASSGSSDEYEECEILDDLIRERLDQCCSNGHYNPYNPARVRQMHREFLENWMSNTGAESPAG